MTYTIKQGDHYSGFRFKPYIGSRNLKAFVQFTPSCAYTLPEANQPSVNKLTGFTMGFRDSARFGWKSSGEDSDEIILCAYVHHKGKIVRPQGLIRVPINKEVCIQLIRQENWVHWLVDGIIIAQYCFFPNPWKFGYVQGVYFGGTLPAPHDIEIYMR